MRKENTCVCVTSCCFAFFCIFWKVEKRKDSRGNGGGCRSCVSQRGMCVNLCFSFTLLSVISLNQQLLFCVVLPLSHLHKEGGHTYFRVTIGLVAVLVVL